MHRDLPLVSVVIPIYNVEKYIKKALTSVINQTYKNIEILCVDDGGKDASTDIVKQFSDPRLVLIKQHNRGLSGARNTGITAAKGEFIALLDADDFWHPRKLCGHVQHLLSDEKIGCSYCPSLFVDDDDNEIGLGQFPRLTDVTPRYIFCRNPVGNGSAPVFRKAALEQIAFFRQDRKMYFDEDLKQSEDIECWTRIALTTEWTFAGISSPYTYYRINMGGLSANLYGQLDSWKKAMANLRIQHKGFFAKYYSLALAYQYRYLARRAIQARNKQDAIKLIVKALLTKPSIVLEEPNRTLTTVTCAMLATLPTSVYMWLESSAIAFLTYRKKPIRT